MPTPLLKPVTFNIQIYLLEVKKFFFNLCLL